MLKIKDIKNFLKGYKREQLSGDIYFVLKNGEVTAIKGIEVTLDGDILLN